MNELREVRYFTDRDLGRKFPESLKAAGFAVVTHDEEFGPLTPDDEWLAKVGANGWLGLTRDARIRYSPLAMQVLMKTGARLFVLVGKLTTSECADLVTCNRQQIEELAAGQPGAFIAKIRRDGVHLWISEKEWRKGSLER